MRKSKKIILAKIAIFAVMGIAYSQNFKRLELTSRASFEPEKSSLRWQQKLLFSNMEFRANENLGTINYDSEKIFRAQDIVFVPGLAVHLPKKIAGFSVPFNFSAKAGMLGAAGLYSRLSAPASSLPGSAFAGKANVQSPLDARLPATSSARKPGAVALDFALPRARKIFSDFEMHAFVQTDGAYGLAAALTFTPAAKINFGAEFVTGRFFFGNKKTEWHLKEEIFPERWFQEFAAAIFFKSNVFSTVVTGTAHEQPAGGLKLTVQNKSTFRYGPFQLNANFFYGGPDEFFCGKGEVEKTESQFSVNPQVRFLLPAQKFLHLRLGFLAAFEIAKGDEEVAKRLSQKYIFGAQINVGQFDIDFSFWAALSRSAAKTFSGTINLGLPKKLADTSFSLTASVSEPASKKYKALAQKAKVTAYFADPKNAKKIGLSAGVSLSEKLSGDLGRLSFDKALPNFSAEILLRTKFLWLNGKISAEFSLPN